MMRGLSRRRTCKVTAETDFLPACSDSARRERVCAAPKPANRL